MGLPVASAADYKLYYLGGQSNMDGYGYVEQLPEELQGPVRDVMIFTGQTALDNETHGGIGRWEPLRPGHGTGFKTDGNQNTHSNRFGPELTFGHTLADLNPDSKVAIVKYSLGGSGLANGVGYGNWYPDFADGKGINQYDHALTTLRNALGQADIDGDGAIDRLVPSGIVWMQGEADAYQSQEAADAYGTNLKRLMDLLRAALRVDDLPVVIGKITDSGMADDGLVMDYIETVQDAQRAFVESDACAAYVTVTDDLPHSDDAWHYQSDGYVAMGAGFADAVLELESACGVQ
jgi:hypothetical protein